MVMPPKILIVDDEILVGRMLEDILRMEGYETSYAMSAEEGLATLQNFMPDLIISDIWMPGMNGYTFCQLARRKSNAPIIMMSGVPSEVGVLKEMNVGADDILIKPIDIENLAVRVDALLKKDSISIQDTVVANDSFEGSVSDDEQDPFEIFKELQISGQNLIIRMAQRLGVSEDFVYQIMVWTSEDISDDEIAGELDVSVHQVQNWRELLLTDYGIDLSTGANYRIKIIEAIIRESQKSPNIAPFINAKQQAMTGSRVAQLPDATRGILHLYANGLAITSISNELHIDELSVKEHLDLACYHLGIGADSKQDRHLIASSLYLLQN